MENECDSEIEYECFSHLVVILVAGIISSPMLCHLIYLVFKDDFLKLKLNNFLQYVYICKLSSFGRITW